MYFPWIFSFFILGAIAGGGIEFITAPTEWVDRSLDGSRIIPLEQCVISQLKERSGLE